MWRTDAGIFGLIPDAAKLMQHMFDRDMFMNEDPYTYNKGINKLLWRNKESYKRTMKEIRRNQAKLDKVCMTFTRQWFGRVVQKSVFL